MNNHVRFLFAAAAAAALMANNAASQSLSCSSAVTLNGPVIEVAGVSGDDTANIQCALDEAAAGGFREVRLTSPNYEIGAVAVTGFTGDLTGISRAATSVSVTDGSLSCSIEEPGVALQFNVGNVAVRNMSITADSPCGDGGDASLIAFYSNPASCTNRTVFGNVDRVAIEGSGVAGTDFVAGVSMQTAPACDEAAQKVLGTLKVNRAVLSDLEFGVTTSIGGGGQVDINFNEFDAVALPISIVDGFQSTTILGNSIEYNDAPGYALGSGLGTTGIFIASTEDSPSSNGTTIRSNTFEDGGVTTAGVAVLTGQLDKAIAHSMVVSDNTFIGDSDTAGGGGLVAVDTTKGLVSGNRFREFANSWIELFSGNPGQGAAGVTVDGWAIVANRFISSTATTDITLGAGTSGIVVGTQQDLPTVIDATGNNNVLESASRFLIDSESAGRLDAHARMRELLSILR